MIVWSHELGDGRVASVRFTERIDGDLRITADEADLTARRGAVLARPWASLRQVHGAVVHHVDGPLDGHRVLGEGDALVTGRDDLALAVNVADCAPVALVAPSGVVAAVHAGWRGLAAGVIERTVEVVRSLGATEVLAYVGPCIHPECYEFGEVELARLVEQLGPGVAGRTAAGRPALDVPMAVAAALGRAGVEVRDGADRCTACDADRLYSHRARGEPERHALVVAIEPAAP